MRIATLLVLVLSISEGIPPSGDRPMSWRHFSASALVLAPSLLTVDYDATKQQLAVNAGRTPGRILAAYSSDQLSNVSRH